MACTNNLQATMSWCAPFVRFAPQTTGSLEPALTSANLVKQTMLGAPFKWRQNRGVFGINLINPTQDYAITILDYGFLEKVSVTDSLGNVKEIEDAECLSLTSEQGRPVTVAVQSDDNAGNFIWRTQPIPDQSYTLNGIYQRKPIPMTSLASLWSPFPDELAYIYNAGYLTFVAMLANDARYPVYSQKFVGHLLAAQDGISDMARNIFLNNWLQVTAQAQRLQQTTQLGTTARTM